MQATRLLRRAALAAALTTTASGAVSGVAHAAPFSQSLVICTATNPACDRVALPDGLPSLGAPLTSSVAAACAPIRETFLLNDPTATVGLCTHELDAVVPVFARVGDNYVLTYSDHYASDACYRDNVFAVAATAVVAGGLESGSC